MVAITYFDDLSGFQIFCEYLNNRTRARPIRRHYDRSGRKVTLRVYDRVGHLLRVETDGLVYTYAYNANGSLQSLTYQIGTYAALTRLIPMTDAAGNVTTYEYNYANLLIRLIRAGGRTGEPGSYTYDFSKITSYTYTADGRVSTVTDRNGAVTVCVYDIHGNLLSRTVTEGAASQSISYTYDHNGNVLTMTDGTGTTTRTYDAWNRTTTKTVPDIGTSFYTYDITDGFDAGCSAESTVDPKGNVTVKVYDRVGRLIYVLADNMTTSYAYYDDGALQSVAYGNGSREDYTYTADKLLHTLVNRDIEGTIIDTYAYTYDAAHNLLSKTDSKGVTVYTYDAQNRILTVTEPSGKTTVYTYDAAGNRASQTETEGTDVTATTYTYDALNRLLRTSESLNGTLSRTVDYTYDNNGNLLTVTSVTYTDGTAGSPVLEQNNTYDLLNQLIRTVTSDGTTIENTYNGDGLRVVKSVNGSLTRFFYQYDKIVLELNALGDQTGRNVYGLNLISRTFGEDTFFYFYNGHADVTALLASDGTIAATYYYDAFGNILDQTGTATSNILYAGYQYDPETGLYYLNARMYDPVTARFIQEDSYLGSRNDVLSLNLYTYCHNEPMMYWDPTGHNWWSDATAWAGDVVKTVAGAVVNTVKSTAKEALQTVAQSTENLRQSVKTAFTQKDGLKNAMYAYFDYQDTPLKLIDIACKNVNKLQTKVMEYTEKKLGIDTNNGVVKAVNNVGKFSLGWSEGVVQWTASAVTGAAKLVNPLYGSYVGNKTKDTVESVINTPTYQQIFSGIQKNPTDVIGNAGKLYAANWNLAISYVQNQYNEIIQDPYKCGQFASKATLDVASLCLGLGEATAASDAAKADLAVAEAEKVADTALDVGKIAANSADDLMRAAATGEDVIGGASGTEVLTDVGNANKSILYSDEELINAANEINKAQYGDAWWGKKNPVSVTQASDGTVVVTKNNGIIGPNSRTKAVEIFGDDVIIPGGKGTNYNNAINEILTASPNHAEARGIQALLSNNIEVMGARQATTLQSCSDCMHLQSDWSVFNITGKLI